MNKGHISQFIEKYYLHFNAAALVDAAKDYEKQLENGAKMLVSLAGAMSTAELGKIFAEMIRQGKVDIISCTGANLEEDIMNLVAHNSYKRVPHYRDLSPQEERELLDGGFNRVTDTCIPEEEALQRVGSIVLKEWVEADQAGERRFPHEYLYQALREGRFESAYQIDPGDSWLVAASDQDLPLFVPGWEDSTLGNLYAAHCINGDIKNVGTVRSGIEYMMSLTDWYETVSANDLVGFFQIGGGIAGDFPICVVPMLEQDLHRDNVRKWGYFCQISDSTTSYGSYSGAVPNEKITWGKLSVDTPKFIIESDATIVAPLIFGFVMEQ